jgi:5,10-methylenetetrahydrofolate reductase
MSLKEKLDQGRFAVLAELEPPKGTDVAAMVGHAKRVKGQVDAFVVPEMSNAVMRMSSLGGAFILKQQGMEAVIQANCRDRNRIALQADLLAAWASGITTVMAVTGEDPSFGDHHQARPVYDIDLLGLLGAIAGLANGRDMAGIELTGAAPFLVGSTVMAGAPGRSAEIELEQMAQKMDAGASFFITPPVFDPAVLSAFCKRVNRQKAKIIPTVMLLKSVGMARYIARNLPHIYLPETVVDRLQKASDKAREGVVIAAETIRRLQDDGLDGVVVATVGWENKLAEILDGI